ncbi:MAG TPA: hypothetical protein DCO83_07545 [Mucilaginibacter sp.]|jgi:ABC-type multidrug transport system fused ATPase/permease subunit|nr:hypothetical protein [Mucilaginibacter sp.]
MKFLPYENFYIITRLRPDEAESRLQQEVSPGNGSFFNFFRSTFTTYFEGYAVNGRFEFKRNINYRNSFLPQIKGTIENGPGGSRVHVKMNMLVFVTIFMCFWLGATGLAAIALITRQFERGQLTAADFVVFIMFLFGYGLTMGSFKFESLKAKSYLVELLDGEIDESV